MILLVNNLSNLFMERETSFLWRFIDLLPTSIAPLCENSKVFCKKNTFFT